MNEYSQLITFLNIRKKILIVDSTLQNKENLNVKQVIVFIINEPSREFSVCLICYFIHRVKLTVLYTPLTVPGSIVTQLRKTIFRLCQLCECNSWDALEEV